MFILRQAPVVRVLIPYVLGSLAGYSGCIEMGLLIALLISFLLLLILLALYILPGKNPEIKHACFCLAVSLLFFMTGVGAGGIEQPEDPGLPAGERLIVRGRVEDDPLAQNGRMVFRMRLSMVSGNDSIFLVRHHVRVYLPEKNDLNLPEAGETWILCGRLVPFNRPGNPGEPDYASILNRKNLWYRLYTDTSLVMRRVPEDVGPRVPGPGEIRSLLSRHWKGPQPAVSLLKALCLGDRSLLGDDLRQSYQQAGGMHLLAVSGLHVGLIWWILQRLLQFMLVLDRRGIYRGAVIILMLWLYAYLTGFSSSVSRSVTMFTFYSLAKLINHRITALNAVLISMFFLVFIQPGSLLDVGFQLSYAAILAIVTLNPLLTGTWRPAKRLMRRVWELSCLSLTAQAGTLPLVIYYFHQVPLYGLITNLIVTPLLSVILFIFVLSFPLVSFGIGTAFTSSILIRMASLMNVLVEVIASLPMAVLSGLFLDRLSLWLLLAILVLLILFLHTRARLLLYPSVIILCFLILWSTANYRVLLGSAEMQISHFTGGSLVTFREGRMIDHFMIAPDPRTRAYMDHYLSSAMGRNTFEVSVIPLNGFSHPASLNGGICSAILLKKGVWVMGNSLLRGFLLSGSLSPEEFNLLKEQNPDFILVSGEPPLNWNCIPSPSSMLVVDGSNRSWYVRRMEEEGLGFYHTASHGALVLTY